VTTDGLVDAQALQSAHRETVLADGAEIYLAVWVTSADGTVAEHSSQTIELGPNAMPVATNGSGTGLEGEVQVNAWFNETASLFRIRGGGETTYRVLPRSASAADLVWAGNVDRYVRSAADAFAVTNVTTRDDRRIVTLEASADLVNGSNGADTEITMAVDDRGVVRSFDLEQRQSEGERYRVEYVVERLGVTPTRPAWVDSIPAGAFLEVELNVEVMDGRIVHLSNAGPDAVPAGSSVTVVAEGVTHDVQLSDPLAAGEERWVWVDAETGESTIGAERPAEDAARSLGGRAIVTVQTPDGVTLLTADLAWRDRATERNGNETETTNRTGRTASD
jgi:hypothetical protein